MIVATRNGGNREVRFNDGYYAQSARRSFHVSDVGATTDRVLGIPALGHAIRVVSGTIAGLRIGVYEGYRGDRVERPSSLQAIVLGNPCLGVSDFDWRWDIASALEASENAFLWKVKDKTGQVVELQVIPPGNIDGRVENGRKVFDLMDDMGTRLGTYTTRDILHIRGNTVGGGAFGVSRIHQHRDPLSAAVAAQRFEGKHYANDARPGFIVTFPQNVTRDQAAQWRTTIEENFGGENRGKPMVLGGGATAVSLPISMADGQWVESRQYSVLEVGRIMDIEPVMLGAGGDESDDRSAVARFLSFQLRPRLARIERALKADVDLFPPGSPLYPLVEVDDLMFADPLTRAQVQHYRIQNGSELVDEARADNGRGPLPALPADWTQAPGQVPQITPVGGAPNPTVDVEDDTPEETSSRGVTVPSMELRVEQDMEPIAREMGGMFSKVADMFQRFSSRLDEQRALDDQREKRDKELHQAHREALVRVGQPNIVVNVPETPVTVENTVNVPTQPVQLTLELPQTQREVKFERDPSGRIVGAEITDQ